MVLLGALTLLVAGVVRAVTGFGDALIAIPVLALIVGPRTAIAICSIASLSASGWLLLERRAYARLPRELVPLLIAAVVGGLIGTAFLVGADRRALTLGVALATLLALLPGRRQRTSPGHDAHLAVLGVAYGIVSGATGIGGPLLAAYLKRAMADTDVYVASLALLFTVSTLIRVAGLVLGGAYDENIFAVGLGASVPLVAGVAFGTRIRRRMDARLLARCTRVFLAAAVILLCWSALLGS